MATITAFSPYTYYARANGSSIPLSDIYPEFTFELPEIPGIHLSEDSTEQAARTWLPALQAHIANRDIFIQALANGDIPPISPLSSRDIPLIALSPSLGLLHASSSSVLDFLGLVEPLADLANTQRKRLCPSCEREIERSLTTSDLMGTLTAQLHDQKVSMRLRGPTSDVATWSASKGFTPQTSGEHESSILLDTFVCDAPSFQTRAPLIRSALQVPGGILEVLTPENVVRFAFGGWCDQCLKPAPPLSRRDIENALRSGHGDALSLLLGTLSLREILALPIERLIHTLSPQETSPLEPLSQIAHVGLSTLTLGTLLSNVSIHHLATLVAFHLLHARSSGTDIAVLDIPRAILSQSQLEKIEASMTSARSKQTIVWLGGPQTSTIIFQQPSSGKNSASLGTLSLLEQSVPPYDISLDSITWISTSPSSDPQRHAQAIALALTHEANTPWIFESTKRISAHFVECFPRPTTSSRLVAHDIGVLDPLAKMYAASHQAKMLGIQAKDFIIGQAKQTKYVCPDCKGAGVRIVRDTYSYLPALSPCLHCWGIRFRSPIKEISFKGKTLGEILNSTIKACAPILQALPKMTAVPELVELLGLASIPMGMPVAALTPAEVRRLSILKLMLAATASTPSIIVLEEPFVDLSQSEADHLVAALQHPSTKGRVSWILVSSQKP